MIHAWAKEQGVDSKHNFPDSVSAQLLHLHCYLYLYLYLFIRRASPHDLTSPIQLDVRTLSEMHCPQSVYIVLSCLDFHCLHLA